MELEIRPATPSDAQEVRAFLEGLSEDSRWLRYHSPVPIVRGWMVDAVVNSDHETREALLAIDGGRVLGVAEWGIDNSQAGTAHVAVVVDEAFRRRGVARELTQRRATGPCMRPRTRRNMTAPAPASTPASMGTSRADCTTSAAGD